MIIEVDKKDLISLVKGLSPKYEVFNHFLIKPAGNYVGGFRDDWVWNDNYLKKLNEEALFDIYKFVKNNHI